MEAGEIKLKSLTNNPSWHKEESSSERLYTRNELIGMYYRGRKDAIEDKKKILLKALEANVINIQEVAELFIENISESNIEIYQVYLRINDISYFDLLFIVNNEDFIDDKFLEVYKHSKEVRSKLKDIKVNFSFIPFKADINRDCIVADGYLMSYGKLPTSKTG